MEHKAVESSAMTQVGFEDGTLEVRLTNNVLYRYTDVPQKLHDDLMASESKGRYFGQHIRGKYPHTKVEEPKPEEVPAA